MPHYNDDYSQPFSQYGEHRYMMIREDYRSDYIYGGSSGNSYENSPALPALHRAARDGNLDTIHNLLNSGTNVNDVTYHGRTALHYAAEYNNLRIINLLINSGIDTSITDLNGRTSRDLLPDHGLQLRFDSLISGLQQHNIEVRANTLLQISTSEENLPALPYEICNVISEYASSYPESRLADVHQQQEDHAPFNIFSCLSHCFCTPIYNYFYPTQTHFE